MCRALAAFTPALLALLVAFSSRADDSFALVNGADPAQFDRVGLAADSLTIEGGEIRLTGRPFGYFATRADYQDFTLRFEYRYDRPEALKSDADFRGNSGVLLHLHGPAQVWPDCVQVQLAQADPGAIFAMGDSKAESQANPEAQKQAVKPVGEWNRIEITSRKGSVVAVLNGIEVARADGVAPARGRIAWQSEGKPIRFRAIRIQVLP